MLSSKSFSSLNGTLEAADEDQGHHRKASASALSSVIALSSGIHSTVKSADSFIFPAFMSSRDCVVLLYGHPGRGSGSGDASKAAVKSSDCSSEALRKSSEDQGLLCA
jgi:hypothetical protein